MKPLVSFVIPAYNAEKTLQRTLESLVSQTVKTWEALVVDDGSSDRTAAIAADAATSDARVRLLAAAHGGVSKARNVGIAHAVGEWVVFLDADDALDAHYLSVMLEAAQGADFVYCGHRRMLPNGGELSRGFDARLQHEAFDVLAHHCALAIHSVLMRRSVLDRVGGFDPELRICEDWDLWQRVARAGLRMKGVPQYLAIYHHENGSLSKKNAVLLADGLKVLRRGCQADPRVAQPQAEWAAGLGLDQYAARATHLAAWCAAVEIGSGAAGVELLQQLDVPCQVQGGWWEIANAIVDGLSVGAGIKARELESRYARFSNEVHRLGDALAEATGDRTGVPTLQLQIERLLMTGRTPTHPIGYVNTTAGLGLDLRRVDKSYAMKGADRAVVSLYAGSKALPSLYLPVRDGVLLREEIIDGAVRKLGVVRYVVHSRAWWRPAYLAHVGLEVARSTYRRLVRPLLAKRRPRLCWKTEGRRILASAARASARAHGQSSALLPDGSAAVGAASSRKRLTLGGQKPPVARRDVWEQQFSQPDPWKYTTAYEQVKYDRTLQLIDELPAKGRVLELACAEGHFTKMLVGHVQQLTSADISATALARAKARCEEANNVAFMQVDLLEDAFPGDMDIVLCSEVLYYMGGREALRTVIQKLQGALRPGGYLVMANHFLLKEDKTRTGFDWDQEYGATTIYETAASLPGFVAEKSLVTELYRIDCFRKVQAEAPPSTPAIVHLPLDCTFEPEVARYIVWGGAAARRSEVNHRLSWTLPVLTYHRVAPEGPEALKQWRVHPDEFRKQMRYLRANGYRAVTSKELAWLREGNRPVHGRPVMITFDDGYQDFEDHAWPILVEHDFNPEVFLVTERVGQHADWDAHHGAPAPLMGWDSIRKLHREGVGFGSHLATHRPATSLTSGELREELVRSKAVIEDHLGAAVNAVAAPHGLFDDRFAPLAVQAGYSLGYSCRSAWADLRAPDFFVNRVEVPGDWNIAELDRCVSGGRQGPGL